MSHEEIIAMAREAGFDMGRLPSIRAANVYGEVNDELDRFAALVAAKEREACAQLCDEIQRTKAHKFYGQLLSDGSARQAAAAIRARGTKEGA